MFRSPVGEHMTLSIVINFELRGQLILVRGPGLDLGTESIKLKSGRRQALVYSEELTILSPRPHFH